MAKTYKSKVVLVIEDEAEIRNFAVRVCELEGYDVLQAGDGDTGLRLARENRVALVLLDLRLPVYDGWSALAQMKSEPELSAIPVIVFTASAGITRRDKAVRMGAADYLVKPLSAAGLRKAVARVLRQEGRRYHVIRKSVCAGG